MHLAFHVVIRHGRDMRMTRIHNGEDEAAARARYQAAVNQAVGKVGTRVQLRDRFGRVIADYLSTTYADDTTKPDQRQTERRTEPRRTPDRRTKR